MGESWRKLTPTERIRDRLDVLAEVVQDCRDEWPMRVRRVFYVMLGRNLLPAVPPRNRKGRIRTPKEIAALQYDYISRDLSRLRVMGEVLWEAITDTHRQMMEVYSSLSQEVYLQVEAEHFLTDYRREHYLHAPFYPEIWIEKDAASTIFWPLAASLRIPLVILKGDASITFVHEVAERARERMGQRGQRTLIVYASDLDPKGYYMLENVLNSLHKEMDVGNEIVGTRALLWPRQVKEFGLSHNPEGVSTTDSRYARYVEEVGDYGVELDALNRDRSHAAVQAVIDEYCGADFLGAQRGVEDAELAAIGGVRDEVIDVIDAAIANLP